MKTPEKIREQVVIITGGGRGIGYGIAQCFNRRGATLVIADADEGRAVEAAKQLAAEGNGRTLGVACDITNQEQVEKVIERVQKELGRIDVLVNNAGICPFVDIMEMSSATWQKTIDVNLTGAFYFTQAVARVLIKQGEGGRIIFITSLAENVTSPQQVDYGASKSGLRMAMAGFATALGKYGITCNAIAPGMIMTDMTRWSFEVPEVAAEMKQRIPVGRVGTPEDIGNVAVFLASDEASYVSGTSIRVDGGHQAVCN
jgi:NAD(P)-dependent dehydrogenase (short-subunit alcohol dehydrogenase family)